MNVSVVAVMADVGKAINNTFKLNNAGLVQVRESAYQLVYSVQGSVANTPTHLEMLHLLR